MVNCSIASKKTNYSLSTKVLLFFIIFIIFSGQLKILAAAPWGGQEVKTSCASQEKKSTSLIILPILFYTPETSLALGCGGVCSFRLSHQGKISSPQSRSSRLSLIGMYTLKKQFQLEVIPSIYFLHDQIWLEGSLGYKKYYDKFWGIGPETPAANEEVYTYTGLKCNLLLHKRITHFIWLGFRYHGETLDLLQVKEGGLLERGQIPGSTGGTISGMGATLTWDSRDNINFPTQGSFHQLSITTYLSSLGSDFSYKLVKFDLRRYFSPLPRQNIVIASRIYFRSTWGEVPFNQLSQIGQENSLRGYYQGRWRDKNLICFQVEYRHFFWKKLGVAAFFEAGEVAHELHNFRWQRLQPAAGLGLRLMIDKKEKLSLRFDIGWGKNSSGIYFTALEAF